MIKPNKIAPTAWIVAYRRTLTDIPYSREIFQEFEKMRKASGEPPIPDDLKTPEIAPQIEARYKILSRQVRQSGIRQIFEMASGISPRGLEFTKDSGIEYVECDLPDVIAQKRTIVEEIERNLKIKRPNLHFYEADVLDLHALRTALAPFDTGKPMAIINEGLLRYLSFKDKAVVARNVKALLKDFGGAWITPDISLKAILISETFHAKDFYKVNALTGVDVNANSFESVGQARQFFTDLGFMVEMYSWLDVMDELVSPGVLSQPEKTTRNLIKLGKCFVMRPR